MNVLDDDTGLNISKLMSTSINTQISELVDGESQNHQCSGDSTRDESLLSCQSQTSLEDMEKKPENLEPHIGTIDEVKPENRWNRHIRTGYRLHYDSWKSILMSLFQWHNETINIWTHLVGFFVYLIVLLVIAFSQIGEDIQPTVQTASEFFKSGSDGQSSYWDFGLIDSQLSDFNVMMSTVEQSIYSREIAEGTYTPRFHTGFKNSEEVSKWPIVAYLFTALFCLGCSTSCHWLADKNPKLCKIVATLDYWGITILILGSGYPFISYRYACGYLIVYRYIFVVICTILCIVCMVITVNSTFLKPTPKAILFISFGVFCTVPTITLYILDDSENGLKPGLAPFSWATLSYLVGMTFYMTRFPERLSKTGRFDILFSSHQIHHLCVLLGVTLSFVESFQVYEERLAFVCPDQEVAAA